jgi:hypothetical protein
MTRRRQGCGAQAPVDCPREPDVVNAVLSGSWPHGCDEALVAHAGQCSTCREVAQVSVLLREDVDHARINLVVPAAGQVWWRAAVRARLESTHAAARPITWMHGITAAMVVGIALAVMTTVWPLLPEVMRDVEVIARDYLPNGEVASALAGGLRQSLLIGAIGAALLVLTPLALYFVLADDGPGETGEASEGETGDKRLLSRTVRRSRRLVLRVLPAGAVPVIAPALVLHVPGLRTLRPILHFLEHLTMSAEGFLDIDQRRSEVVC